MVDDPIFRGNTLTIDTGTGITDILGAPADPTTLTLTVRTPSGVTTIYTYPTTGALVRDGVGLYHVDVLLSEIGVWEYEWTTTAPDRVTGDQVYVQADPIISTPSMASVSDYTRLYLGGDNWNVLVNTNAANFGISFVILGIEAVKRRVLTSPPAPSGEAALNQHVLAYLGILSALELIPAAMDAWASKIISRSVGADPTEVTTYTDRAKMIESLQKLLLSRVEGLRQAALPYLEDVPGYTTSSPGIDEDDDLKVTSNPRCFPPASTFPYRRDEVVTWR